MINATDIAFVYQPVSDLAKSREFYEGILGLKVIREVETDAGPLVEYTVGSSKIAIGQMDIFIPSGDGVIAVLEVADFGAALESLQRAKVKFYMEAFETPLGEMALILDPDGSKICICGREEGPRA